MSTKVTLEEELRRVKDSLSLRETEDTWDAIASALAALTQVVKRNSLEHPDELVLNLRAQEQAINNAITSERSRLSGLAIDLIAASAVELGDSFQPLLPLFAPTLLTLSSRPNKVFVSRARTCLITIISSTQSSYLLTLFSRHARDKAVSVRLTVAEATVAYLHCANPPDVQKETHAKEIETLIRTAAVDANADVRKYGRQMFDAYKVLLPGRISSFTAPLTPTIRKYLNIRAIPGPSSQSISRPASALSTSSGSEISGLRSAPPHSTSVSQHNATASSYIGRADAYGKNTVSAPSVPDRAPAAVSSVRSSAKTPVADLKPKHGPLRPCPTELQVDPHSNTASNNHGGQRHAGGARRVLRPEQVQKGTSEKPAHPWVPIRPSSRSLLNAPPTAASSVVAPVQEISRTLPISSDATAPSRKSSIASSGRRPEKPHKPPPPSETELHSNEAKCFPQHKRDSRLTKPTMSQLARETKGTSRNVRANSATQTRSHLSSKTGKKSHQTRAGLVQVTLASSQVEAESTSGATPSKGIRPAEIPLPPSPTGTMQLPTSEAEDVGITGTGNREPPVQVPPCFVDPATPKTSTTAFHLQSVEQTPITALVDSIRDGFIFTQKQFTRGFAEVNDSETDDIFRTEELPLVHVPPLNLGRKANLESR